MFACVRVCVCTYAIGAGLWNFVFSNAVPMEKIVLRNYPGGSFMCHLKDKEKKKDEFFPVHAMEAYRGVEV